VSAVQRTLRAVGIVPSAKDQLERLRRQTAETGIEKDAAEKAAQEARDALTVAVTEGSSTAGLEKAVIDADAVIARLVVRSSALQQAGREALTRLAQEERAERVRTLTAQQAAAASQATKLDGELDRSLAVLAKVLAAREEHVTEERCAAAELEALGGASGNRPKNAELLIEETTTRLRQELDAPSFKPYRVEIFLPVGTL
jgi:hypothetical protein